MSFLETYTSLKDHFNPLFLFKNTFLGKCQEKINKYIILFFNNSKKLNENKNCKFEVEESG